MKLTSFKNLQTIHPILKILVFILILVILYVVVEMPVKKILVLTGLTKEKGWLKILILIIEYSLSPMILIIGSCMSLRIMEKKKLKLIGLRVNSKMIKEVLIGIFFAFILTGIIFIIELAFGWITITGYSWQAFKVEQYLQFIILIIFLHISVAFAEEVFSRGYIMWLFERMNGKKIAIVLSSVIFGLLHLYNAIGTLAIYVVPFSLTLIGVLYALLYYLKRSLWIPIAFHFAWNFFEYGFFSLTGNGIRESVFFVTDLNGPPFWVGLKKTSFGPEVGALGIIVVIIAILLIYLYNRNKSLKVSK